MNVFPPLPPFPSSPAAPEVWTPGRMTKLVESQAENIPARRPQIQHAFQVLGVDGSVFLSGNVVWSHMCCGMCSKPLKLK